MFGTQKSLFCCFSPCFPAQGSHWSSWEEGCLKLLGTLKNTYTLKEEHRKKARLNPKVKG